MHTGPNTGANVTVLLQAWSNGDREALDKLTPVVYQELRRLARHYMRGERSGHTLQTAALVNEAYMRLVDLKRMSWHNRAHFFAVSAQLMRRILVDHARRHNLSGAPAYSMFRWKTPPSSAANGAGLRRAGPRRCVNLPRWTSARRKSSSCVSSAD